MNNSCRIFIALVVLGLSLPASASVTAQLDHDQVGPSETVQLTLQHDGQTDTQPELSPLKQDFEIVGRSSGSNIQIINGKMNSKIQISLMLMPKHGGKLHIPALQWDGESTPFLPLEVSSNGAVAQSGKASHGNAPTGNASHVFITETPEQNQLYVQAAIPMTVRVYTDQPLYQASLDLQPSNDVLVQQLGQDRQANETRNGKSYQVIERKYLLFPQRSGRVQLGGAVLNAQVQDTSINNDPFGNSQFFGNIFGRNPFAGMLNATRPIRVQGDPVVLNVRPRPANASGRDWLPAQNVTLEESWQPDNGTIHAGDPVTRHLRLSADGLTAAQLPDLTLYMQLPDGLRTYPDQAKLNNDTRGNSIIGTRDQDIAIIANTPGRYEVPALHLVWWDTEKNTQREVSLPARALDVLPSTSGVAISTAPPGPNSVSLGPPAGSSSTQATENTNTKYHWNWISLAFALLWLATLAAWWLSNRIHAKQATSPDIQPAMDVVSVPRSAEARKAFQQSCRENDTKSARRHLLEWACATWPNDPPVGLMALAERLDDAAYEPLLNQLDRACYTDGVWQGELLLKSLKKLSGKQSEIQPLPKLASLYP